MPGACSTNNLEIIQIKCVKCISVEIENEWSVQCVALGGSAISTRQTVVVCNNQNLERHRLLLSTIYVEGIESLT